jgi:hypothetical protein
MNTETPTTNARWEKLCCSSQSWYQIAEEMKLDCRQRERELTVLTEQLDAVTLRLGNTQERMFDAERQRDRLAEALRKIKNAGGTYNDPYDELDFIDGVTFEALQSLTTMTDKPHKTTTL